MISVISAWGEPLKRTPIGVFTNELNGPWTYEINSVPAFNNLVVSVSYSGPWSLVTGGGSIGGQSGSFDLKPNTTATQDLNLKTQLRRNNR